METAVICDTNIFIEIFRNNTDIEAVLVEIGIDNILVSDVVRAELFFGANNKRELNTIKKHLNSFTSLTINTEISKKALKLVETYCLSQKLNLPDALIAATAIFYNTALFTLNIKDFVYIPDLKLYLH